MKVSAESWNRFVDRVFRSRIIDVRGAEPEPWRHPWYTRLAWLGELEAFAIRVKPGYCLSGNPSGAMATTVGVEVPGEVAPAKTKERLGTANGLLPDTVEAWLREDPVIPLPAGIWRKVGTDAEPFGQLETVPRFFRKRGVNPAPQGRLDAFGISVAGGVAGDGFPIHDRPRLLRACDLVLYHDRPANSTDWQLGTGVEGTIAQFRTVPTSRPDRRERPYLRIVRRYDPPAPLDPVAYLQGGVEDAGTDSIRMATLYLLGPRQGEGATGEPEAFPAKWEPHVRHDRFWNLRYLVNRFEPGPDVLPLEVPGLELAAGSLLNVAPLAAATNDAYQQALAFVQTRLIEGRFVTL